MIRNCALFIAVIVAGFSPSPLIPEVVSQTTPRIAVTSPEQFHEFCATFYSKDIPQYGNLPSLWANQFYQDARSFLLDNYDVKGVRRSYLNGDKAFEVAFRVDNEILQRSASAAEQGLPAAPCPQDSVFSSCPIVSCNFISGLNCVTQDITTIYQKKESALRSLVKILSKGVKQAANTAGKKTKARQILKNLPEIINQSLDFRRIYGVAYICEPR